MGKKQIYKKAAALAMATAMAAVLQQPHLPGNGNRTQLDTGGMKMVIIPKMSGAGWMVMGTAFPRVIISVQTVTS